MNELFGIIAALALAAALVHLLFSAKHRLKSLASGIRKEPYK